MDEERTEVIETTPSSRFPNPPHATDVHETTAHTPVPRTEHEHIESVTYDPYENRRLAAYRLSQFVYWVFGLVEGLIAIRLILKALGANPSAGFSQFIYSISTPLVGPFIGLFSNPTYQNSILELSSIVALIVYALVAWLIAKLIWIMLGETRSAVHARSTHVDSRI